MTFLILSLFISNDRPAQQIVMFTFPQAVLKVFLLQILPSYSSSLHTALYCTSKVTGNCCHLSSLQAHHHLRDQVISCIIRKSRNSYTLQVCPYLYLMVHVCLKVGHVGLLGGQPIPSPGGRLQLSAVSSSSFSQWYLSVRK